MYWLASLLVLLAVMEAGAQTAAFRYRGSVHAEGAVGVCAHGYAFYGAGGGGEVFLWKRLSGGVRGSVNSFSDYGPIGVVLGEVGYHFVDRSGGRGADPFLSFGLGVATQGTGTKRSGGSGSLGGGVNYWFNPRVALRVEARTLVIPGDGIFTFQFGVAFR